MIYSDQLLHSELPVNCNIHTHGRDNKVLGRKWKKAKRPKLYSVIFVTFFYQILIIWLILSFLYIHVVNYCIFTYSHWRSFTKRNEKKRKLGQHKRKVLKGNESSQNALVQGPPTLLPQWRIRSKSFHVKSILKWYRGLVAHNHNVK